jgi:hypothetical protein
MVANIHATAVIFLLQGYEKQRCKEQPKVVCHMHRLAFFHAIVNCGKKKAASTEFSITCFEIFMHQTILL